MIEFQWPFHPREFGQNLEFARLERRSGQEFKGQGEVWNQPFKHLPGVDTYGTPKMVVLPFSSCLESVFDGTLFWVASGSQEETPQFSGFLKQGIPIGEFYGAPARGSRGLPE